jgi:tetratricopeptide (TPR) repeat protein
MGARLSSRRGGRKRSKDATTCAPTLVPNAQAMALKDLGNEHFRAGKYKEAEQLYSQAYELTHAEFPCDSG